MKDPDLIGLIAAGLLIFGGLWSEKSVPRASPPVPPVAPSRPAPWAPKPVDPKPVVPTPKPPPRP